MTSLSLSPSGVNWCCVAAVSGPRKEALLARGAAGCRRGLGAAWWTDAVGGLAELLACWLGSLAVCARERQRQQMMTMYRVQFQIVQSRVVFPTAAGVAWALHGGLMLSVAVQSCWPAGWGHCQSAQGSSLLRGTADAFRAPAALLGCVLHKTLASGVVPMCKRLTSCLLQLCLPWQLVHCECAAARTQAAETASLRLVRKLLTAGMSHASGSRCASEALSLFSTRSWPPRRSTLPACTSTSEPAALGLQL